jgi:hypothetical protein
MTILRFLAACEKSYVNFVGGLVWRGSCASKEG